MELTAINYLDDSSPLHVHDHDFFSFCTELSHNSIAHTKHISEHVHSLYLSTNPRHSLSPYIKSRQAKNTGHDNPISLASSSLKASRASRHVRFRSLTASPPPISNEMTTFATQPPGSPPGLTASKSSKSSSVHSSSLTGGDTLLSDISHFEEIGLEDEQQFLDREIGRFDRHSPAKRSLPHPPTTMSGIRSTSPATATTRELTNGHSKPMPHSLEVPVKQGSKHNITHSLSLPKPPKRGFRSPSTPSLAITAMQNRSRSRSPSPTHVQTRMIPPHPLSSKTPELRPSLTSARRSTTRRPSGQITRKTVKELEDECNDSDDDLPDDASLWNVPISPSSQQKQMFVSARSAASSASTSPERSSPLGTSLDRGMTPLRQSRTTPVDRHQFASSSHLPSSPFHPRGPSRSTSMSIVPDPNMLSKGRAKSWTAALSDLSEETKSLTEALEAHAKRASYDVEATPRPGIEKRKSSLAELPPLRKNNVMIDPLPISKEKEKVLSRTRPSWLPPKNRKEERKHLKEYQRMMELSLEAEKKRAAKAATQQCARDDTKSSLLRVWEEHVLPNWDQVIREPRTRELWWRGIAPRSRSAVWQRAIGNELSLTESTYKKALQRAKDVERDIAGDKADQPRKEKLWFDAIQRDVNEVFPELKIFQLDGPLHGTLVDVLIAYSMYRSDVGYCPGIHFVAAFLLLNLPDPSATFTALANLLNRPLPLAFLTEDSASISKSYVLTLRLLAHKLPLLHSHLFHSTSDGGLGLTAEEVLEPMMRTLFLHPSLGLGLEKAARIWDVLVFDGDAMIVRSCVGVLAVLESRLYGTREEMLQMLGWDFNAEPSVTSPRSPISPRNIGDLWDRLEEDDFMGIVRGVGKEGAAVGER